MMSLELIKQLSREAAEKAAREKLVPFMVWADDIAAIKASGRFPFPDLGDHRPDGWTLGDELFCDSSGFGATDEPALTTTQLVDRLVPGKAYAIIQVGLFQLYIGEFARIDANDPDQDSGLDFTGQIIAYEQGDLSEDETVVLFQALVNNGMAWTLQGHYGRTARDLIEAGLVISK